MSIDFKSELKKFILVFAGSLLMAVNLNTFVHSANLIPGGFTGLTIFIQNLFLKFLNIQIPFSLVQILLNIFPIYIGFRYIGKKFTLYSILMIVLSSLLTDFIPGLNLTQDILLCSVFGGIINALAINFCLMAGSSSGGTDFISIFISEKTGKNAWNYILAGNICVLIASGILLGWNAALYSIIFQYVSTTVLNFVYKKYSKITLLIITDKADEIYKIVKDHTNHSATVFTGEGSFSGKEHKMVYTVVSGEENSNLEKQIRKVDPDAFINVLQSKEIIGRFFKRAEE